MKILSLNTWGGRAGKEGLLRFFTEQDGSIDVFCSQEVWSAPYDHLDGAPAGGKIIDHSEILVYGLQEIAKALPNYNVFFHPHNLENYGLMTLVKKDHEVLENGEVFVHKYKGYVPDGDIGKHARNIQYVTLQKTTGLVTVVNFHGLWNGKGKTDSEDRLTQSANILKFLDACETPFVLCGDFNLLPETESLKMLEQAGLRNLVKEYGITSTRTSIYTKPEKHADYVFVSGGVSVEDFKVLPDEVSDHSALLAVLN